MQSDKRQTSNSYLQNVLVDGANSFYYRSGVRSLLDFPESEEGNMAFSLTLPAIGFRYINHSLLNERHSIQDPRNETDRFASNSEQEDEAENSLITPMECIQSYEPVKEKRLRNPDTSEKSLHQEISQKVDSAKHKSRQDDSVSESKQKKVSGVLKNKLEKPHVIIEKSKIEIPGFSENNSFVPASKKKERSTQSSNSVSLPRQKVSATNSRQNLIKKSLFKTQENTSTINSPSTSISSASERLRKTDMAKEKLAVNPSQSSMENPVAEEMRKRTDQAKTAKKDELLKRMTPFPFDTEEKRKFRLNQTPYTNPSRYIGSDVFNKSNRKAAERIEQLQHAVQRLASKVSSQQAKANNETQLEKPAQMQPPPVQPVVIRKRFSNQTSTPSAFWERSYLSHFHLKTLR